MSKTMKLLIVIFLIAGGAFGLARVLNVNTSELTGFTGLNAIQNQAKNPVALKTITKDPQKLISIDELRKIQQQSTKIDLEQVNKLRSQIQSNTQKQNLKERKAADLLNKNVIPRYNFFLNPDLIKSEVRNNVTCDKQVQTSIPNSTYQVLNENNVYYEIGNCEDDYPQVTFMHEFTDLEIGEIKRFANPDAVKAYKITKLAENKYNIQYLHMNEAWEHTLHVNSLTNPTSVSDLQDYGPYKVGLFQTNESNQLLLVTFK